MMLNRQRTTAVDRDDETGDERRRAGVVEVRARAHWSGVAGNDAGLNCQFVQQDAQAVDVAFAACR
jgi:hypothetical protein